jgi:hypothetical protein
MFVPKMAAGPEQRTQAYFAVQRGWMAHWPFEHGKYAPRVLLTAVLPVAPVWYQVEPQIKMHLDPEDFVSRAILETGEWEPTSWQAMRVHLGSGATFVDVGAHIGYYSLKAAMVVGPGGHVIAIERNPETLSKLQMHIRASSATAIAVQPVAYSDAEAMRAVRSAGEHRRVITFEGERVAKSAQWCTRTTYGRVRWTTSFGNRAYRAWT